MTIICNPVGFTDRVYRAASGPHPISFSGRVTSVDATIEARVVNADTGAEVENLGAVTTAAGANWRFGRFFYGGPGRSVKIREAGKPETEVTWPSRILVGTRILVLGQSNIAKWVNDSTKPHPRTWLPRIPCLNLRRFSGWSYPYTLQNLVNSQFEPGTGEPALGPTKERVDGNAMTVFLHDIQQGTGTPACAVHFASGGQALQTFLPGGANFPYSLDDWDVDVILIVGGEANVASPASYYEHQVGVVDACRTRTGEETPVCFGVLGPLNTSATDDQVQTIRDLQYAAIEGIPSAYLLHSALDMPLADNQHRTVMAQMYEARRAAQTVLRILDYPYVGAWGPKIVSGTFTAGQNRVRWTVEHDGGSVLKTRAGATSGAVAGTGFRVLLNDVASAASHLLDGGDFCTDMPAPLGADDEVKILPGWGKCATGMDLRDNAAILAPASETQLGCPVRPGYWATAVAS